MPKPDLACSKADEADTLSFKLPKNKDNILFKGLDLDKRSIFCSNNLGCICSPKFKKLST